VAISFLAVDLSEHGAHARFGIPVCGRHQPKTIPVLQHAMPRLRRREWSYPPACRQGRRGAKNRPASARSGKAIQSNRGGSELRPVTQRASPPPARELRPFEQKVFLPEAQTMSDINPSPKSTNSPQTGTEPATRTSSRGSNVAGNQPESFAMMPTHPDSHR